MDYRLGIDLGTDSLGWCLLELDSNKEPTNIIDAGVHIFSNGRNEKGESLAVERRIARSMRRRRERFVRRKNKLINYLIKLNLLPSNKSEFKSLENPKSQPHYPYLLRNEALHRQLKPYELGRVLLHLNQRRGFKSSLKTKDDIKESKEVMKRAGVLNDMLKNYDSKTIGELFYKRIKRNEQVLCRDGAEFRTLRSYYENEFNTIVENQKKYFPNINDYNWKEIKEIIYKQRPLKPQIDIIGNCEFIPNNKRSPKASPYFQIFRIWQDVNNIRIVNRLKRQTRNLTQDEKQILFDALNNQKTMKKEKISKLLNLQESDKINLFGTIREDLKGNQTRCTMKSKDMFGPLWDSLDMDDQHFIVTKILQEPNDDKLREEIGIFLINLEEENVQNILSAENEINKDYGSLSVEAIKAILPGLEKGLDYSEACLGAGFHHSKKQEVALLTKLPYYGEILKGSTVKVKQGSEDEIKFGRIANPTVHIALNRLRVVVNSLIKEYGNPSQIVIELTRDLKNSKKKKKDIEKRIRENTILNKEIRKELSETHNLSETISRESFDKLKLYKELKPLNHCCVYCGKNIGKETLFSDAIEIEHILPFSRTLDNSFSNKVLAHRHCNQIKGNKSPYEAFGENQHSGYIYDEILKRAETLPKVKQHRFDSDAMDKYEDKSAGFIERQLTDTAYITKISRDYLTSLVGHKNIWAIPGKLTAMLRYQLGLNSILGEDGKKNRFDHRHHAVDSVAVAITDRSLLQKISQLNAKEANIYKVEIPEPWKDFRHTIQNKINKIIVSHRPDHGKEGRLLEETAYGFVEEKDKYKTWVKRESFINLTDSKIKNIRDKKIRNELNKLIENNGSKSSEITLKEYAQKNNIKRIRILVKDNSIIRIPSEPYKGYASSETAYVDIWSIPFKKEKIWEGIFTNIFEANQNTNKNRPHPAAKLVMRLFKRDCLRLIINGEEKIMRVIQIAPSLKSILLTEHSQGGPVGTRNKDIKDPFYKKLILQTVISGLPKYEATKVHVSPIGKTTYVEFRK